MINLHSDDQALLEETTRKFNYETGLEAVEEQIRLFEWLINNTSKPENNRGNPERIEIYNASITAYQSELNRLEECRRAYQEQLEGRGGEK